MVKDFDNWNALKQKIDLKSREEVQSDGTIIGLYVHAREMLKKKFIKYFQYETPLARGISEAESISALSISPTQNLSTKVLYYRVTSNNVGIYEQVDILCSKDDLRRVNKPDGSWLRKEGQKYPGAISYFTELGFEKYNNSGLFSWHKSIVENYKIEVLDFKPENILYSDEYQIIVKKYDN